MVLEIALGILAAPLLLYGAIKAIQWIVFLDILALPLTALPICFLAGLALNDNMGGFYGGVLGATLSITGYLLMMEHFSNE